MWWWSLLFILFVLLEYQVSKVNFVRIGQWDDSYGSILVLLLFCAILPVITPAVTFLCVWDENRRRRRDE